MNAKDYAKKIALGTCIYYTAATFLILFLYFVLNVDTTLGVQPVILIAILPFAFFFAVANTIYRHTELEIGWRILIHYTLSVGGAFLFLYLPNKDPAQSSAAALLLFLIFTLIYFLIMGTIWTIRARIKRVKRDEAKYYKVYKK
jgi:hypothetical protein